MIVADEPEEQVEAAGFEDPSDDVVEASVFRAHPPGTAGALGVVAVVAFLINALSLSASQLWVRPDSLRHIEMGVVIAGRFEVALPIV